MKKQKRTKTNKWAITCDNCYRGRYCSFVIDAKDCIMFRPKDK